MGGEIRTARVGYTIRRGEHLPEDVDADEVAERVESVLEIALRDWYRRDGHRYLVIEPTVV